MILLSPDSQPAATEALAAWPGGLQVGGGVTADNALEWLDVRGAAKVIVTSWLFPRGRVEVGRLEELVRRVGGTERVVIDLSCRRVGGRWMVAMERWSRVTEVEVCKGLFVSLFLSDLQWGADDGGRNVGYVIRVLL